MKPSQSEDELQAQSEPSHVPHGGAPEPISLLRLVALVVGPLSLVPFLVLPPPTDLPIEGWRLIGMTLWMVIWWLTETLPLPATALMPIALMPVLGIRPIGEVTAQYGNHLIFLFLGGFILAAGMQRWGLHRRIALLIVAKVGKSPEGIVAGFMLATAFLSMWISNTATTVMMFTVGISVIDFIDSKTADKALVRNFGVGLMLAIAYSASIGGVGTLIGTPPNALLASLLSDNYGIEIGFFRWMLLGMPVVIVMLPLCYLLLTRVIFPARGLQMDTVQGVIQDELAKLGRMDRGETIVAIVFGLAAFCWIFRSFLHLPVTDSGIAMIAALLLFALPVGRKEGFVLDWSVARSLPWGVLMLFGGGLALAAGFESSGLAKWIGTLVGGFSTVPLWVLVAIVSVTIIYLTEITSNTASTATFLPILGAVAVGLGLPVEWLTLPVALGASMAFMMPVATPPNAIVFSYDGMTLGDMVKAGFVLNILSAITVFAAVMGLAPLIFGL
ncbi:Na(+)/dicarboxylate symporter [Marinibacterium anthonyi]|nr:Na(+)/dicarboxylate symporter [Marinibacterium anthonyi]